MADRSRLHINKLEDFMKWLIKDGWKFEEPEGTWEVLRARKEGRQNPLIVYTKMNAKEHLSVMDRDSGVIGAYLRDCKEKDDVRIMERLTTYKTECNREMICRYEDCDVCEEYCPHLQEDNCSCLKEILEKLGAYEDAEEQGLLRRLPCKVGDVVYAITSPFNLGIDMEDELDVFECVVESIAFYRNGLHQIRLYHKGKFVGWLVRFTDLGKTVFLTREEAENALEDMKGKV